MPMPWPAFDNSQSPLETIDRPVPLLRLRSAFVLAGGGNTSVKIGQRLLVKASATPWRPSAPMALSNWIATCWKTCSKSELSPERKQREEQFKQAVLAARTKPAERTSGLRWRLYCTTWFPGFSWCIPRHSRQYFHLLPPRPAPHRATVGRPGHMDKAMWTPAMSWRGLCAMPAKVQKQTGRDCPRAISCRTTPGNRRRQPGRNQAAHRLAPGEAGLRQSAISNPQSAIHNLQ